MGRYLGPKCRISRAFGDCIFGYSKVLQKRNNRPGQHGSKIIKKTEYGKLLAGEKKFLYVYNIREGYMCNVVKEATRRKENTNEVILRILESRLDNVVFRLGMSPTRKSARQAVSHKHITVNGKVVNIASYLVKKGDTICYSSTKSVRHSATCSVCSWLEWDDVHNCGRVIGIPSKKDTSNKLREEDIVEYHSR